MNNRHVAQLCWHMLCLGEDCRSALFVSASATKVINQEKTQHTRHPHTPTPPPTHPPTHHTHTHTHSTHPHSTHTHTHTHTHLHIHTHPSTHTQGVVLLRLRRDDAYIGSMLRWLHLFVNRYLPLPVAEEEEVRKGNGV